MKYGDDLPQSVLFAGFQWASNRFLDLIDELNSALDANEVAADFAELLD